jgi:hypothetical protein
LARRTYVSEPINAERGDSRAPIYLVLALALGAAGYTLATKVGPSDKIEIKAEQKSKREGLKRAGPPSDARG